MRKNKKARRKAEQQAQFNANTPVTKPIADKIKTMSKRV